MHRILERQIRKFLGNTQITPELKAFFAAVSDSYTHFEEDKELIERSLELSSKELTESNKKLKEDASVLTATLDSTAEGVLVVDMKGKITIFNKRFIEMWNIPPSIAESHNDSQAINFVIQQLKEPKKFLAKVKELYGKPDIESYDVLEFKDGRIFERYSLPQKSYNLIIGRVWTFRDITSQKKAEEALHSKNEELEKFNSITIGRELRMVELKKHLKQVEEKLAKYEE